MHNDDDFECIAVGLSRFVLSKVFKPLQHWDETPGLRAPRQCISCECRAGCWAFEFYGHSYLSSTNPLNSTHPCITCSTLAVGAV